MRARYLKGHIPIHYVNGNSKNMFTVQSRKLTMKKTERGHVEKG